MSDFSGILPKPEYAGQKLENVRCPMCGQHDLSATAEEMTLGGERKLIWNITSGCLNRIQKAMTEYFTKAIKEQDHRLENQLAAAPDQRRRIMNARQN